MNSFLNILVVTIMLVVVTTVNAMGIENRDMSMCERKSNGLCKCDMKDVFGASCNSCRSDDACGGSSSKCVRSGIVQEESLTGWCKVQDVVSSKYLNGKPHIELALATGDQNVGKFDLYRENENNRFQSVLSCDISDCSQMKDHKNNRVFTKCNSVDTCRATCTVGKGKDHWCNKVTEHFNELERSGFTFGDSDKDNGRMKFMCKNDGKHCVLQESYGLMPEFASLNKVECAFSECVNRDDTTNLRA